MTLAMTAPWLHRTLLSGMTRSQRQDRLDVLRGRQAVELLHLQVVGSSERLDRLHTAGERTRRHMGDRHLAEPLRERGGLRPPRVGQRSQFVGSSQRERRSALAHRTRYSAMTLPGGDARVDVSMPG